MTVLQVAGLRATHFKPTAVFIYLGLFPNTCGFCGVILKSIH